MIQPLPTQCMLSSTAQEHLSLEANALCALPPALCTLPALRHLDLSCNQLVRLALHMGRASQGRGSMHAPGSPHPCCPNALAPCILQPGCILPQNLPLQAWLPPGLYLRTLETLLLSANRLAQVGCMGFRLLAPCSMTANARIHSV